MKPSNVDEYLASFPADKRDKLVEIRGIIRKTLPETTEALKWNAPATIDKDGMILLIFSGHKDHMNFTSTPATMSALADDMSEYDTGAATLKLPYDKPLPVTLLRKIATHRSKEYREDGIKWK